MSGHFDEDDLAFFFQDFGTVGTLDGQPVLVIFDNPVETEALGAYGGAGVATAHPRARLRTAQVPASPFGKLLVIPQGRFTVREHEPDGTGLSVLRLSKAAP
jgi:hypothetical protein